MSRRVDAPIGSLSSAVDDDTVAAAPFDSGLLAAPWPAGSPPCAIAAR